MFVEDERTKYQACVKFCIVCLFLRPGVFVWLDALTDMGLIRTSIQLSNPRDSTIKPVEVRALVDTGVMHLCIPEHVARQLHLEQNSEREVTTTDGHKRLVPYVGPVEVNFNNRRCYVGTLVFGDEVFLGAVPMEDMDLVVSLSGQTVVVNPESPNIPSSVIKVLSCAQD